MTADKETIVAEAKKHAKEKLAEAVADGGGDYWNTVEVEGKEYDYNLWDKETDGKEWNLSVYPVNVGADGYGEVDCFNPIVEGLPFVPEVEVALDCTCCGIDLIEQELNNREVQASGHCFHCLKGNCEICGSGEDDND